MERHLVDNKLLTSILDLPHLNNETHYDLRIQVKWRGVVIRDWTSIMDFDLLNKDKLRFDFFLGTMGLIIGTVIGGILATLITLWIAGQIK